MIALKRSVRKLVYQDFYSNHSLRGTSATRMYRSDIDEQLIMEITGHRSLAVRSYKRTSDSQRRMASNCLFFITKLVYCHKLVELLLYSMNLFMYLTCL